MATTHLAPIAKQRALVYSKMPEPLKAVSAQISKKTKGEAMLGIMARYDIGALIAQVHTKINTYGEKAIEQLAAYHLISGTTLYGLKDFSENFEREYVEQWSARELSNGGYLSEKHWHALRLVTTAKDRDFWLKRTISEGFTANELSEAIKADAGNPRRNPRNGGRHHKAPLSPMAGIQQFRKLFTKATNYVTQHAETSIFDKLDEAAPDDVSDILLSELQIACKELDDVETSVEEAKERLTSNIKRVESILAAKVRDAETAASTPVAEEADEDDDDTPAPAPKSKKKKDKVKKKKSKRPAMATT